MSPQFLLEGAKILDPTFDLGKLRGDQLLEAREEVLAASGIRVGGDLPDACQGEADLFGTADEPEALEVPVRVHPVP